MTDLERRANPGRRVTPSADERFFSNCPRYNRYELTEEQIKQIVEKVMTETKRQASVEFTEFAMDAVKKAITAILIGLGIIILGAISYFHDISQKILH